MDISLLCTFIPLGFPAAGLQGFLLLLLLVLVDDIFVLQVVKGLVTQRVVVVAVAVAELTLQVTGNETVLKEDEKEAGGEHIGL